MSYCRILKLTSSINLVFIICLTFFETHGQVLVYDDVVYVDYIETVKLSNAGSPLSFPTVDLSSNRDGVIKLKFDDMEGGYKEYTYSIIHCDKDWYPSDIDEIEYLDGFNGEEIENFEFSSNGYSEYTNYSLTLPNDEIRWTISGNYLLVITDAQYGTPVISRRFIVNEDLINIQNQMIKPRDVSKINTHHEFKLSVSYNNFQIDQPRLELFVTMMQNDNWNTARSNLKPTFERGKAIYFDQYDYISFPALKEFRSFDIRPLTYTTEFVEAIDKDEFETTVLLDLNRRRSQRSPVSDIDANGKFLIDNDDDLRDAESASEYCNVIFNLESDRMFDEDVYIVGAFSDWQAKEKYRMEYDPTRNLYLGQAYFKQGYYNYMFALKNEETGELDIEGIEDSWFETENDYTIIVYYREYGGLFDRIIAVQKFNSNSPIGVRN